VVALAGRIVGLGSSDGRLLDILLLLDWRGRRRGRDEEDGEGKPLGRVGVDDTPEDRVSRRFVGVGTEGEAGVCKLALRGRSASGKDVAAAGWERME
jgi:hypothetical protein